MIVVAVGARGGDNVGGGVIGAGGAAMSALSNKQHNFHDNGKHIHMWYHNYNRTYTQMQYKCYGPLIHYIFQW